MDCNLVCPMMQRIMEILRQLEVAYGYLIANAPTEETRRLMSLNLMTVRHSMEHISEMMNEMAEHMTPTGETMEAVPVFVNFVDAARYAFLKETQVIAMLNNMMMLMDDCHRDHIQMMIVDHELNAMRLLYVLG